MRRSVKVKAKTVVERESVRRRESPKIALLNKRSKLSEASARRDLAALI